ncbi:MAG: squalene/phytoene synthase family protein [Acidobacteriota bacterium]
MADLDTLLVQTSRTFALSIPLLPEPTRREVTISYLLFRIADTFEDAAEWPRSRRIEALHAFAALLDEDASVAEMNRLAAEWVADTPIDHAGYQDLLRATAEVIEAYRELSPSARARIRHHTVRTAEGMAGFVARTDDEGHLVLDDLDDLRAYCYVVAGIVGELCTDLFLLERSELEGVADELHRRARWFGEALQLVNILKDAAFDATEGRAYLPPGVDRDEVFALARRDLVTAHEYVLLLQDAGAHRGLVAFNALPVLLADAALAKVESEGPGSKISRDEVFAIAAALEINLDAGRPAVARLR